MNIPQGFVLGLTLISVAMMGSDLKHEDRDFPWWVYLGTIAVLLADYAVMGRM